MKRWLACWGGVVLAVAFAHTCEAQVKERWRLEFELTGKPQIFVHRTPLDKLSNYWYYTYKVKNPTDERIPLLIDTMLYVESGKGMQHDVAKVDIKQQNTVYEKDIPYTRVYEKLLYGRFYSSVIFPEVEYDIIVHDMKIGNRPRWKELNDHVEGIIHGNRGIQEESILAFKKAARYLNPREIRLKQYLQPGEEMHGIAIFEGIDPRANVVEIHVSGLWDIFKVIKQTDEDVELEYENKVLKMTWEFAGDPFEREKDWLFAPPKREWITKKIGPIASRHTIDSLVQTMVDYLKIEADMRIEGLTPEQIAARRHDLGILEIDIHVAARAFQQALVKEFGYKSDKSPYENRHAIWRMHEFWLSNKSKIAFDAVNNRYVIRDDILPGLKDVKKDH